MLIEPHTTIPERFGPFRVESVLGRSAVQLMRLSRRLARSTWPMWSLPFCWRAVE